MDQPKLCSVEASAERGGNSSDDHAVEVEVKIARQHMRSPRERSFEVRVESVDPESLKAEISGGNWAYGFTTYFLICLLITLASSGLTVGLWSNWGCGLQCLEFLQRQRRYAMWSAYGVGSIILVLYVLDFFSPPHLPGRHLTFSANGQLFNWALVALVGAALLATLVLQAASFPGAPLMLTIFVGPVAVILISRRCLVETPESTSIDSRGPEPSREDLEWQKAKLMEVVQLEESQKVFYTAATWAFALSGALWFVAWVPWAITHERETQRLLDSYTTKTDREEFFIRWAVPVAVAVSHAIFSSFTGLRVALNRAYNGTDVRKNRLFVGRRLNPELTDHHVAQFLESLKRMGTPPEVILQSMQDKRQTYLVQHISYMRQLSGLVKLVGCAFIACLGGMYVAFQLTVAHSQVALFIQGFVGAFFLFFVAFVFVTFRRLFEAISAWLIELPLWKSVVALNGRPWARGFAVCMLLPFLPLMLALSFVNQRVRRCRGLSCERTWLTPRVHANLEGLWTCSWVSVAPWCYIWAYVLVVYTAVPVFLYVLLAWMGEFMRNWPFPLIVAATYVAGMFLFMLPPVPGPPIYLFGGVVISEQCPWGFWWGCFVSVLLAFALKLTACTVQQKLIGERLGSRLGVRRAVRVHKPFIRAIEVILRRPGLSFGKCAILCGGPDWPTSVLAGILRVSLWQCILGTCPIILNCIPLTLTGSFLTRRQESEVWLRSGNLMFSLTVLTSVVFWVGMAWAIQEVFEKHMNDLVQVKEEYLELDWLDYRDEYVRERCVVRWGDLPRTVQQLYGVGALAAMAAGNMFFWRPKWCFGSASVTEGTEGVVWYGESGIIRPVGAVGLCVVALSSVVLAFCRCWVQRLRRERATVARAECEPMEKGWKEVRLQEAKQAAMKVNNSPRAQAKAISSEQFFLDPGEFASQDQAGSCYSSPVSRNKVFADGPFFRADGISRQEAQSQEDVCDDAHLPVDVVDKSIECEPGILRPSAMQVVTPSAGMWLCL